MYLVTKDDILFWETKHYTLKSKKYVKIYTCRGLTNSSIACFSNNTLLGKGIFFVSVYNSNYKTNAQTTQKKTS